MTQARKIPAAIVLAGAATFALVVSGCSSSSDTPKEVTVVGKGEVRGAPDILNANVGIEATAPDVSGAVSAANERARAMIDALTGAGVAKEDVQTSELSIQPEYANPGPLGGASTISGYRATNSVRIVVRDLSKASDILDKAVAAGGDAARLNGVSFDIDDDSKLVADARARAFNDAKARAEQYAQLSGLSLDSVITINETSGSQAPQPGALSADRAAAESIPIEPGQQTVNFQVTVKWELG